LAVVALIATASLSPAFAAETTPALGIRDKTPSIRAFTNARIIVSPQVTYDTAVMVINEGKVVAIGKGISIPADAVVTDLAGKTIYPGFIDPCVEYGLGKTREERSNSLPGGPQYEGRRAGGNAWNEAIHAEKNWIGGFRPDAGEARKLMQAGITVVQSARMDGIFRGRAFVATLGSGLPNDQALDPEGLPFLSFNKGSSKQVYPSSLMGSIALIRQAFYDADWYVKAHAASKLKPNQKLPEFNAALDAIARLRGGKAVFEVDDVLSLLRAEKIAKEFGLTFIYVGSGREYAWIKQAAATGAMMILPVDFPEPPAVKTAEDELDVTLGDLRRWEMAPSNPKILEESKVNFAFTSYRLKDKSDFLANVRLAVKRGLTKQTALAALTTVPAQICGVSAEVGTLERGKLANFIIADGDLFDNEATIYSVWVAGKAEEFEKIPKIDLRGDYQLSFAGHKLELALKGKALKPKGECKLGGGIGKLDNVSVDEEKLRFAVALDTLGYKGVLRFSGGRVGNDLSGQCWLPDGSTTSWSATLTAPFVEKPDSTKMIGDSAQALISTVTYPNKAYGLTEQPKPENVLLRNATVWTSEAEGVLANTDILIVNGKFAGVGKSLAVPEGARIIDATGKQVTAGLIDEHSHIAVEGSVSEEGAAVTSEVRIGDVIDPEDINIYRILAGGVTMSNVLHGSDNPIGGQCAVIKHKWGSPPEAMLMTVQPPTIKFALGENVKQSNMGDRMSVRYPQSRMGVETIIKDEFQAAREYEREWTKFNAMSAGEKQKTIPPRKDLRLDAIVEVLHSRLLVHCHAYVGTEMLMLMRLAEEFGFRIRTFEHVLEGYKIADEMVKHGAMAGSFSDWWAYKFEVFDAIAYSPALMTAKGVTVAINSDDAEMARRLNQEAGKSIGYGDMKPEEAIKMVTINPAIELRLDKTVGSIAVGKDADFVIWNGNPLSTYSMVEQTWIEGRRCFDREVDTQLRDNNRREKNALIQKALRSANDAKKAPDIVGNPDGSGRIEK
jgi:imidazolonepropionase-like amidohydrolase